MAGGKSRGSGLTKAVAKARGISRAEAIRLLRQASRDIDFEIALLRARQQGIEKAMSILQGEGP
jgi:hypothetical protein